MEKREAREEGRGIYETETRQEKKEGKRGGEEKEGRWWRQLDLRQPARREKTICCRDPPGRRSLVTTRVRSSWRYSLSI